MESKPQAPGYVRWVVRTLEESGYETWAVGGAIRNTLLGLPAGDWDIATQAPPPVVQKLFPRTVPVGVEHGTVGVLTRQGILLEVTTFRKDVETSGRHAVVEFADTLQEDLARRDFTVNAVAWHPIRETYLDPYHGREDLEARLLRTVGSPEERFSEDYLRVLRGLRFSGRFGLRIHGETWRALCGATNRLGILSPERIREELLKVLGQDPRPSGTLALYAASGVLEALYPELSRVEGCHLPGRKEEIFAHSLLLTDFLSLRRPLLRLTALFQGLGIPTAAGDAGDGPESRARDRAAALMIRGRFSKAEVEKVTGLLTMGLEPTLNLSAPSDLRRWLHQAGPERLPDFSRIWLGKARLDHLRWGVDPAPVLDLVRRFREELSRRPPLRVEELALNGRDLIAMGKKPGPDFGEILADLMAHVLEDPGLNTRARLTELVDLKEPLEGERR